MTVITQRTIFKKAPYVERYFGAILVDYKNRIRPAVIVWRVVSHEVV